MIPHKFKPAHYNFDPYHPNAICAAVLQTATKEKDGYNMQAQCGRMREEHDDV